MPLTMPSMACSSGASSNTTLAALPPSSRVSRWPVPAIARWISLPTSVDPVNAILSTPGWLTSAWPVAPAPVRMLTVPGGRSACWMTSARSSAVSGVVSAGLSTQVFPVASAGASFHAAMSSGKFHGMTWPATPSGRGRGPNPACSSLSRSEHAGVPGRERGSELPRRHEQREVPWDDLARNAERTRPRAEPGVLELVRPAGVVEKVRGGQRDVHVAGLPDGLAVVQAFQHSELAGPLLDGPGDPVQVLGPVPARHRTPGVLEGVAGRGHRAVHVRLARLSHLGQRLLRGRVQGAEMRTVGRRAELPADEQAVAGRDRRDVP